MNNIGEEIAGEYLKVVKGCHFIQYNTHHSDIQGEIDVIGVDIKKNVVYICEVAVHLVTGLQYVKNNQPDNYDRLYSKFVKNVQYAKAQFPEYDKRYMLWSPVVRNQKQGSKHNQLKDVERVAHMLKAYHASELELIINQRYKECMAELRTYASKARKELKSPVLRLMQIEAWLESHVSKIT